MHVSQRVSFVSLWKRRIFFHYEIQQTLDHLDICTPLLNQLRLLNQIDPNFKILPETSPILPHFSTQHQSVFLKEVSHQLVLLCRIFFLLSCSNNVRDHTLQKVLHPDSSWPFYRENIWLPVLSKWLQKFPTMTSYYLFESFSCPLWQTRSFFNHGSEVEAFVAKLQKLSF